MYTFVWHEINLHDINNMQYIMQIVPKTGMNVLLRQKSWMSFYTIVAQGSG